MQINEKKECSVEGCDKQSSARGFCKRHYTRFMKHGSPFIDLRVKEKREDIKCIVEKCTNFQYKSDYCKKHALNLKLYGDAMYFDKKRELQKTIREHSAYNIYYAMRNRVSPNNKVTKKNYYDRGITICERWLDKNSGLENFLNDMGERPSKNHSIDRIDNDKGYSPENCRWATTSEQARNTRQSRMVTYDGVEVCLKDFCEVNGYNFNLIYRRILRGMTLEEAIIARKNRHYHDIEINGINNTLSHWSKVYGFSIAAASSKLKKGFSIEDIIEGSKKRREAIDRCKNKKTIKKN